MRPLVRRGTPLVLALAMASSSLPALAAPPDPLREAASAERAGDWRRAADALGRALEAKPSATLQLRRATALEKSGRLVEALAELERTAADKALGATARKRSAELRKRVPQLTIDVEPVRGLLVMLDGREISRDDLGSPIAVDPGTHRVSALVEGRDPVRADPIVREGERQTVHLDVRAPRRAADPAADAAPAAAQSTTRTVGWVSIGLGAIGVGAGAYFGIQAKQQRDRIHDLCLGDVCAADHRGLVETGKQNATASTIAFGAGGAAIVLGIVLLANADDAPNPAPRTAAPRPSVQPYVGLGDVGLHGRF
jgi:hypothetical protein